MAQPTVCVNCDQLTRRPRKGLCPACCMYARRHGGEARPPHLQRAHVGRLIDRDLAK